MFVQANHGVYFQKQGVEYKCNILYFQKQGVEYKGMDILL